MDHEFASKSITKHWNTLLAKCGSDAMMPRDYQRRILGSGDFGCVFFTGTRNLVFKLTDDELEAKFVERVIRERIDTPAIVRYQNVIRIPYGSIEMFGLWREEAHEIGSYVISEAANDAIDTVYKCGRSISTLVEENDISRVSIGWRKHLHALRSAKRKQWYEYRTIKDRLGFSLMQYEDAVEALGSYEKIKSMASTLKLLFQHNIVLCDVRRGNIGKVARGAENPLVIIDPGRSVFLSDR